MFSSHSSTPGQFAGSSPGKFMSGGSTFPRTPAQEHGMSSITNASLLPWLFPRPPVFYADKPRILQELAANS